MVFPLVMYGYESWTIKKAEHQRIDAFELWCWRRFLKSPLDCKESKKVGIKLNIQKTKIMASSPITSWQIDGEIMETMTDFIFLGSKMTADSDGSHEIKDTCSLEGKL